MRTTSRLCLALAVTAAAGLAAVPATAGAKAQSTANAHGSITTFEQNQNTGIRRAHRRISRAGRRINGLKDWVSSLSGWNTAQEKSITGLKSTVAAIVAGVPAIVDGLNQLKAGLVAAGDGLKAIDTALKDPVTGLVGLNNARPQFAAFHDGGGFIAGTSSGGGQGPNANAGNPTNGYYTVDFNNDVSRRFLTVNVFPTANGSTAIGQAVSCVRASTTCGAFGVPEADYPQRVLVAIQGQPGGPGTAVLPRNLPFSVAAISG